MKRGKSNTAFLFVDLQNDFLQRGGLQPEAFSFIEGASALLKGARNIGAPIIHIHTEVSPDGSNALPHWRKRRALDCVKGSWGAAAPEELSPLVSEGIVRKSFYSGFETGVLGELLADMQVDGLVIAGLYTHACVRSTALDAYARGYSVTIALDAVASPEPLHAEVTRDFLEKRGIPFLGTEAILGKVDMPARGRVQKARTFDSKHDSDRIHHSQLDGFGLHSRRPRVYETNEFFGEISSMKDPWEEWRTLEMDDRVNHLEGWRNALLSGKAEWIHMIVKEVDKPIRDAEEEFLRALSCIETAIEVAGLPNEAGSGFKTSYRPVGTVAIITPWNNPMAIPVGKIAPALLYGNAVIWKPSPFAERLSRALLKSLSDSGLPIGLVKLFTGDAEVVRELIRHPSVSAVSLTGSINTGRSVAALCSAYAKPLQAELGGNNSVIVRPDADLNDAIPGLVRSAFGFSGQRCTATRRLIVDRSISESFIRLFKEETAKLVMGMPLDTSSDLGPLISERHAQGVEEKVRKAIGEGAMLVYSGTVSNTTNNGRWFPPTILVSDDNDSDIVQKETFGPVAVVQVSEDMQHALQLADGVRQGLVAGMIGGTSAERLLFRERIQAGILNIGSPTLSLDMHAPFTGWKDSSIGTPEHGRWDREFFSRVQAVYARPE
jgi:acyl-CoA reductase-like NAD-dependent aldehyde dehydrogenase/nicotinamidase-related amidase